MKNLKFSLQKISFPVMALVLIAAVLLFMKLTYKEKIAEELTTGKIRVFLETKDSDITGNSLRIMADSGNQKVAFTRIVLVFDPAKIQLKGNIITNPNLSTIIEKTGIDTANIGGRTVIVMARSPSDSGPSGTFELASLTVDGQVNEALSGAIKFDTKDMQIVDNMARELIITEN